MTPERKEVQQLMDGIKEKNRLLTAKNDDIQTLVQTKAQAEHDYNIAVAKRTLDLKIGGEPVTTLKAIVSGDKTVAKLKMDYDVAEGVLRASYKSIDILMTNIDSYRTLLSFLKEELSRS